MPLASFRLGPKGELSIFVGNASDNSLTGLASRKSVPMGNDLVANENEPRSWAPEVLAEGHWSASGLRFATQAECERYGRLLLMRWFVPTDSRAVPSTDAPNYVLNEDGTTSAIAAPSATGVAL